ncbi:glycosyltransferase family 4 protein [Limibacter armeniacum]|uniref:glycosyltransferase family 4 protein n=1 Tax=Limibacter armeniacum TaxID=466084 RepID=UPI002FE6B7D2
MKKFKIEILTHSYPPDFGAAPFLFQDMAIALKQKGFDVEVLTAVPYYPTGKVPQAYRGKLLFKEMKDGIPVRRHWLFAASLTASRLARLAGMLSLSVSMLRSLLHMLKRKPDVILVQTPPMLMPFPAIVFSKLTGAKLVINVSDLWPKAIADLGLMKESSLYYKLLTQIQLKFYKTADQLMAQSEEISQYIQGYNLPKPLLYRVGADCQLFVPKNNNPDQTGQKKPFRIIYTGVLNVAHAILRLCKDINFQAIGCELHIYGDGFEGDEVKAFLNKHPNRGIFLHSVVSLTEVAQLLTRFDAALISQKSTIRGTLPAKVYESMAAGIPILFNGGGEGASLVLEHKCGLISDPLHLPSLLQNIASMKSLTKNELDTMGKNGRNAATKYFDRSIQQKKLFKMLDSLLNISNEETVEQTC